MAANRFCRPSAAVRCLPLTSTRAISAPEVRASPAIPQTTAATSSPANHGDMPKASRQIPTPTAPPAARARRLTWSAATVRALPRSPPPAKLESSNPASA